MKLGFRRENGAIRIAIAYLRLRRVAPSALEGDRPGVEGRGPHRGPEGRGAQPRDGGHYGLRICEETLDELKAGRRDKLTDPAMDSQASATMCGRGCGDEVRLRPEFRREGSGEGGKNAVIKTALPANAPKVR